MGSWRVPVVVSVVAIVAASCAGSESGQPEATEAAAPVPVSTIARPATTLAPDTVEATAAPVASTTPAVTDGAAGSDTTTIDATTAATTATTATTTTVPPDPPPPNASFDGLSIGFDLVVDLRLPTTVAWRDGDNAMFVGTQDGFVHRIDGVAAEVVLDLSAETVEFQPGSERGLLGIAFDPRDGRMFVDYTDLDHNTHVISFAMDDDAPDLATRREVLFLEQPGVGHNGGRLVFDDKGTLFIGSGDGGGSNGRDAQDVEKLFGALLRVTPKLDAEGYDIPPDNPFADGVSDRPEIYARGFRNPWTFSLDDETGDVWIGDVGNEKLEEIDVIPGGTSGQNFGWYWFEGTNQRRNDAPEGMTPPVFDYPRSDGVAVMGGHVYRGTAIPALRGAYLFADLTGPVWAIGAEGVSRLDAERVSTIVGWAEGPDDELYLLGLNDGVYRLAQR